MLDHLISQIDRLADTDLIWSWASHDHNYLDKEYATKKIGQLNTFFGHALERGFEIKTYSQFYDEMLLSKE